MRKIQSAQLKKTYHKEIAAENQKLEEKKKLRRQAATIAGDKSTEDLNADGNDDFTDKYISQKLRKLMILFQLRKFFSQTLGKNQMRVHGKHLRQSV